MKPIAPVIHASIIILLFTFSCTTTEPFTEPEQLPEEQGAEESGALDDQPDWLWNPPIEEDAFFGIGADADLTRAKELSIINAGQQFSVQVKSVLTEHTIQKDEETTTTISRIDEQVTDHVVYGAKYVDQYRDPSGRYWILTRVPLNCILDATEGCVLSYNLELRQDVSISETIIDEIERKIDSAREYYIDEHSPRMGDIPHQTPLETIEKPAIEDEQDETEDENDRAFGLGYAVNPFNGRWLGGVVSFYILDIVSVVISLYPYAGNDGFGLTFAVNDWLLQGKIAGILSGHLGLGMWVDYFSRDQFIVGIGLGLNSGLQFALSDRFEIFLDFIPGIGVYINDFMALLDVGIWELLEFGWPIPISAGALWRF